MERFIKLLIRNRPAPGRTKSPWLFPR